MRSRRVGLRGAGARPRRPAAVDVLRRARGAVAVRAGRLAGELSRRLGAGEGAVIAGRVTLALDATALARLTAGRRVVLVTGTNGKSTTAHLAAAALRAAGAVAHNETGANMAGGVAAALARAPEARLAVLEVDELHLRRVAAAASPAVVVLLNLSRDQLDRSGEVARVAAGLRAALADHPPGLVLANCDDPAVVDVASVAPRVQWVAGGAGWRGDAALCPRCGGRLAGAGPTWRCPSCGLRRPEPDWWLGEGAVLGPGGTAVPLSLRLPGHYNRRNALSAVAAAAALGVAPDRAATAAGQVRSVAHRYAAVRHGRHRLTLLLAKNPAGWRELLPLVRDAGSLLLAVNSREADGRDTSWLWDVPFEQLPAGPTVAGGEAAADLGVRLSYAGIGHLTEPDPLGGLRRLPPGEVTVIANYTAFEQLWRRLDQPA